MLKVKKIFSEGYQFIRVNSLLFEVVAFGILVLCADVMFEPFRVQAGSTLRDAIEAVRNGVSGVAILSLFALLLLAIFDTFRSCCRRLIRFCEWGYNKWNRNRLSR